jgi:uncharacterized glyoxalase superfamily protein PhnB
MPTLSAITPMLPAGNNMQAAIDFYTDTLGFTPTYTADDLSMVILKRDAIEIIINNTDDPHTASQTAMRVQVAGVDALHAEYRAHGIAPFHLNDGAGLTGLQSTPWGTREFSVRDLAGVCITFFERV